jgi:hypothetical protein
MKPIEVEGKDLEIMDDLDDLIIRWRDQIPDGMHMGAVLAAAHLFLIDLHIFIGTENNKSEGEMLTTFNEANTQFSAILPKRLEDWRPLQ